MSADILLSRLERVKRTAPGRWMARCPAHKDRTASLSVRELDDGRVLVHDFAGCELESVLAAAGLSVEDLFPPRPVAPGAGRPAERRPYSMRDLIGALASELRVAMVLLSDLAAGKDIGLSDRKRAGVARERVIALLHEIRNAG